MPALVFEGLTAASITLAAIYFAVAVHTIRQLRWLHWNSPTGLNTRKLFVLTCLLTAVLRVMSFSSMAFLDFANENFHLNPMVNQNNDDDDGGENNDFFNGAFLILFDFPDFCGISAYMLLILVWAESYLRSRRHWLSNFRFRRFWMLTYFVFNTLLYASQVTLYTLVLAPFMDNDFELTLIYVTLATFNIGLPVCWSVVYIYMAIQFSGFPFSSEDAKTRLRTLSRLGLLWTTARLAWGIVALTTVVEGWLNEARKSTLFYTVVLICIFLFVEVIPICVGVRQSVLNHFSERDVGNAAPPVRYQTLPQDPNSIVLDTQHNVLLPEGMGASTRSLDDRKPGLLVAAVHSAADRHSIATSGTATPSSRASTSYTSGASTSASRMSAHSAALAQATARNTVSNAYLSRADTFTRADTFARADTYTRPPVDPASSYGGDRDGSSGGGLRRADTWGFTGPEHTENTSGSADPTHFSDEYWHGRISGHHVGSYTSAGSYHTAGSYDTSRRNNARSWSEWLGFTK